MDYNDIFLIASLGVCAIIILAICVHNLVIGIRNKMRVKQARKFLTENPKFHTYKTMYLLFDEKVSFYMIHFHKTKATIDVLIKDRIYIASEGLPEYDKEIENLRQLLKIYSEDKKRNSQKRGEALVQMLDYLKEKFPKLSSDKVEAKMCTYIDIKDKGE